ncbi:hypothetical protein SAMN05421837_113205 [Amycolatopsis pretoriensis]|uniref:Uncharacterized protein n=1 Tax=Amycolatopsis pretoriensis TaxID=218821 RepID=A0A1H5RG95_9PSEU|nr:hypothetical protein SAMN05421837_113205 [Amycolatopsis pretoriensis]
MAKHDNSIPGRRRPLRPRPHPRPKVSGPRSVVAKIAGNILARIIAEWLKDLLGDLWNKLDWLWDEFGRFF